MRNDTLKAPRMVEVNGRFVTKEMAEMLREMDMHRFARGREVSPEDLHWCEVVCSILRDMEHPLRYDDTFVLAFARRLPRVIGNRTTDAA